MKRSGILYALVAVLAMALTAVAVPPSSVAAEPPAAAAVAAGELIAVVDQGPRGNGFTGQRIQFLKRDVDWSSPDAVAWTLKIPGARGWGHITDVKTRVDDQGRQVVLVSAGGGMAGAFTYPGGELIWSADTRASRCGTEHNPHSIELIPAGSGREGGQYAVADSAGYVIYYPVNTKKPECYELRSAHGVLYSDTRLWAVGYKGLVQYDIRPASLKQVGKLLSVKGFEGGHDLAAGSGNARHKMWVTDHNKVYVFDKYAGPGVPRFKAVKGKRGGACVKSIGNHGAEVVETRPCRTNDPARCVKRFQTNVVDFYVDGKRSHKDSPTGCFYKARPVIWDYY